MLVTCLRTDLELQVKKSGSDHQPSGLQRVLIRVFQTRIYTGNCVLVCMILKLKYFKIGERIVNFLLIIYLYSLFVRQKN